MSHSQQRELSIAVLTWILLKLDIIRWLSGTKFWFKSCSNFDQTINHPAIISPNPHIYHMLKKGSVYSNPLLSYSAFHRITITASAKTQEQAIIRMMGLYPDNESLSG